MKARKTATEFFAMPLNVPPCLVDDPDVRRIAEEVFIIIIVTIPPQSLSPPPSSPSP